MSIQKIKEEWQKMLELIVVIILIGFFINVLATSIYNLFPQAMLWFTISFIAILFLAVYFVLVSRVFIFSIKETIPFVFAVNIKEVFIPFFELWGSPLSFASFDFRKIIEEKPELKEKIETTKHNNTDFDTKFFLDLTTFSILRWLSQRYGFWWLYERRLEYSFRWFERPISKPSAKVEYSTLRELFKNNIFSTLIDSQFFDITVPPNTTISIEEEKNKWSIILKNKYCRITISTSLSTWSHFWLLQDVPVRFSSEEKRKEYATFDFFIDFEARFNRILSLSPWMKDYYDWAEGMLKRLRDDFDWRIQVQKIRTVLETLDSRYFAL